MCKAFMTMYFLMLVSMLIRFAIYSGVVITAFTGAVLIAVGATEPSLMVFAVGVLLCLSAYNIVSRLR
jgi:hypothetical protein